MGGLAGKNIDMKTSRQLLFLNLGGIVGACLSLFLIPDTTTVRTWAIVSVSIIALSNVLVLRRRKESVGQEELSRAWQSIIFCLLVLFGAIIARRLFR